METRYTQIVDDRGLLSEFHKWIDRPVDEVVEMVEVALNMFPNNLKIKIVLLADKEEVSKVYLERYGKHRNYKAFISLSLMTIYISVKDVSLKVLGHEIAHGIINLFFTERPPYKIHELMAQYAERHMTA